MAKSMWVRCPKCKHWCYAEKKGLFGRLRRSFVKGDQKEGEDCANIADKYLEMRGMGKIIGRAINAIDIYKHGGEMLGGDNYRFYCDCGNKFGADNEDVDMSEQHALWIKAVELSNKFCSIKSLSDQEKQNFTQEVQETLAKIENTSGIDDAKSKLYNVLGCCYFYFFNDSDKALLEIDKSLGLFDDKISHILKGLFMGKVHSPVDNYNKMNELLKINEYDSDIKYVDKETVRRELEQAEKNYGGNFMSIPVNQRKFLVVTSEYTYLPNSFKVIKYNDTQLSGIVFENGFPNNNAIYVCHPYKPSVYFPSETYQTDLFKNQLNEFRELLQCLGAKSIKTENSLSVERTTDTSENLAGSIGGEYKGYGGKLSGEHKNSNSIMESMIQKMLIDDEFSFNPDMAPSTPDGLVWYDHMEEWQRLSRMRLRGQNKYSISISTRCTHIVNENEANQINAEFKALIAKGNLEVSQSSELKASEESSHEWKLVVEFYPLSDYEKKQLQVEIQQEQNALPKENITSRPAVAEPKKRNYIVYSLTAIIAILLIIIGMFLL